jgi:hypothetical protein
MKGRSLTALALVYMLSWDTPNGINVSNYKKLIAKDNMIIERWMSNLDAYHWSLIA